MHRPLLVLAVLSLLPLLAACGGSSGFVAPPDPILVELGVQASTVPSRTEVPFANPLAEDATLTSVSATGPFALDPADLPAAATAGGTVFLGLLFSPVSEGPATGTLVVAFQGATTYEERTYEIEATAESVDWVVSTPTLDYGAVDIGEVSDQTFQAVNVSAYSPVTLTSATLPNAFSIVGTPFPMTVEPAGTATLTIRFAPSSAQVYDGAVVLGPTDQGGGVTANLVAEGLGTGDEVITDYGTVSLDSGDRTPTLSVAVPSDAISLFLEAWSPSSAFTNVIGLDTLTGPGAKEYENSSETGAYIWNQGWNVFTAQVPNTDQTNVQLVPGGGTYTFRLKLMSGLANSLRVRAIVERRDGSPTLATLPLNVWLADGLTVSAATAASDTRLQAVLGSMDTILAGQGIRLGDIDYYDVTDPGYDEVLSETEFFEMLETTSSASEVRLNLFFVETALGGGVVGVSATVGGPKQNGTELSGVMSVYSGYSTDTIGLIAAHELGHYLGLFHTVESNGDHDFIDDTAECAANGANTECPTAGGGYLMHWLALGGTDITDGQGTVIRGHPHMTARTGGSAKPLRVHTTRMDEVLGLPTVWCGTCRHARPAGK